MSTSFEGVRPSPRSSELISAQDAFKLRQQFQAALMIAWNPLDPAMSKLDGNARALEWVGRYGAAYADLFAHQGVELHSSSLLDADTLARWQKKLDEYLAKQRLSDDLAKLQPRD